MFSTMRVRVVTQTDRLIISFEEGKQTRAEESSRVIVTRNVLSASALNITIIGI